MTRRADKKARASHRNAKRAEQNAMTVVDLDPVKAMEAGIRQAKTQRHRAELRRARMLNEPLREPGPDATVIAAQTAATKQRAEALKLQPRIKAARRRGVADLDAERKHKEHTDEARRWDIKAAEARTAQLEEHWRAQAVRENVTQAKARGETLEEVATAVPEWVRDEHGAIVHNEGLPVLTVDRAVTRRRRNGLEWERDKRRISEEQFKVGKRATEVWAAAAQAAEPGRAEAGGIGGVACKASPGPADWRMVAMNDVAMMEAAILKHLPGPHGLAVLRTTKTICYEGLKVADLAGDNRYEAVRIEEQLKVGLAMIRYWMMGGKG